MSLSRALIQTLESLQRAGLSELPRPVNPCWTVPHAMQVDEQSTAVVKTIPQEVAKTTPIAPAPIRPAVTTPGANKWNAADHVMHVATQAPRPELASYVPVVSEKKMQESQPASPAVTSLVNSSLSAERFMKAPVLSLAERQTCLASLAQKVSRCKKCAELASTRTQTVFGVGDPQARIMFIGEAPGADEDKQGEPFVGRAGQLLNKIIAACGWTREELYICNILRCRPPGNRNPTPVEASNCREHLDAQIETVNPEYIVCWGTIAAQNLLGNNTPIGRLRGQLFEYGRSKVLCTYHPSYLLRNPPAKKFVWEDLKILLREMGIDPEQITGKA